MIARLRSWWRATRHSARTESEMDTELRAHMDAHAEHLIATGVPPTARIRPGRTNHGSLP